MSANMLGWDITDFGLGDFEHTGFSLITLRNGNIKNDKFITDTIEKAEKRINGIVLHLLAVDVDGKIKIRWNKNYK